jgi:hypothetical protein
MVPSVSRFAHIAIAAGLIVAGVSPGTAQVPSTQYRVAGCYSVSMGRWRPWRWLGNDAVLFRPPAKIELKTDTGVAQFERGHRLVRPAPGALPSFHRFAYYLPAGPDSVQIVFTTGFDGLTMRLQVSAAALVGSAETFTDDSRSPLRAPVRLTRERCASPRPN